MPARAVARQSIERTSSPRTYSRRLSNSVPCPRTCTLVLPSSSRSRASRDGRCRRAVNGGQHAQRAARRDLRLTPRESQGAVGPHDDELRAELAPAPGQQRHDEATALAGGQVDLGALLGGPGRRLPGVAHPSAHPARPGVQQPELGLDGLTEQRAPGDAALHPHRARIGRRRGIRERDPGAQHDPPGRRDPRVDARDREQHDGHRADGDEEGEATGDEHVKSVRGSAGAPSRGRRRPRRPRARRRPAAGCGGATSARASSARGPA